MGIITADKFDKQAYIAKNTEIENLNTQMRANITQAAAAALAQYTAEERKAMAGSLTHERGEKHGASRAASKGGEKGKDKGSKGASKSGKDKAASKTTKKASKADPKNAKGGK